MPQHSLEVSHEGMMIRGTAYVPEGRRRVPTLLLLHGFTGDRIETGFLFVRLARAMNAAGLAAVTFDFRHSGESDGSFERMLVRGELSDTLRMYDWMLGQPFVDRSRAGLLGFSLGGLVAACASARVSPCASLVLIAPTTVDNICRYATSEAAATGPVTLGPHTLHPDFFDDVRTFNPVADVAKHPRPTLLIQGGADTAVTPAVSQAYIDAMERARVPLTVSRLPDANHAFSKPIWQQQLIASVVEWMAAR